jgi:SAM-dependent methyltransferase
VGRAIRRRRLAARRVRRIRRPRWLALRRTTPLCDRWGAGRGDPVDRWYIERFMAANRQAIRGSVLEVQRPLYTERFGAGVREQHVLDIDPANPRADIVTDLAAADSVPDGSFDCIILTQTLQYVYDVWAAVGHCHRVLRPGGVLLCTVPCVSRIEPGCLENEYWRFTGASCRRLFESAFGAGRVRVTLHGNVLTDIAFLAGISRQELSRTALDRYDEHFPLLAAVRAEKAGDRG